jgi:hypothetical protein
VRFSHIAYKTRLRVMLATFWTNKSSKYQK